MAIQRMSLADYNVLNNIPIINADLALISPVANSYYRHTGESTEYIPGKVYYYDGEQFKPIDGSGSGSGSGTAVSTDPSIIDQDFSLEFTPIRGSKYRNIEIPTAALGQCTDKIYFDTSTTASRMLALLQNTEYTDIFEEDLAYKKLLITDRYILLAARLTVSDNILYTLNLLPLTERNHIMTMSEVSEFMEYQDTVEDSFKDSLEYNLGKIIYSTAAFEDIEQGWSSQLIPVEQGSAVSYYQLEVDTTVIELLSDHNDIESIYSLTQEMRRHSNYIPGQTYFYDGAVFMQLPASDFLQERIIGLSAGETACTTEIALENIIIEEDEAILVSTNSSLNLPRCNITINLGAENIDLTYIDSLEELEGPEFRNIRCWAYQSESPEQRQLIIYQGVSFFVGRASIDNVVSLMAYPASLFGIEQGTILKITPKTSPTVLQSIEKIRPVELLSGTWQIYTSGDPAVGKYGNQFNSLVYAQPETFSQDIYHFKTAIDLEKKWPECATFFGTTSGALWVTADIHRSSNILYAVSSVTQHMIIVEGYATAPQALLMLDYKFIKTRTFDDIMIMKGDISSEFLPSWNTLRMRFSIAPHLWVDGTCDIYHELIARGAQIYNPAWTGSLCPIEQYGIYIEQYLSKRENNADVAGVRLKCRNQPVTDITILVSTSALVLAGQSANVYGTIPN